MHGICKCGHEQEWHDIDDSVIPHVYRRCLIVIKSQYSDDVHEHMCFCDKYIESTDLPCATCGHVKSDHVWVDCYGEKTEMCELGSCACMSYKGAAE